MKDSLKKKRSKVIIAASSALIILLTGTIVFGLFQHKLSTNKDTTLSDTENKTASIKDGSTGKDNSQSSGKKENNKVHIMDAQDIINSKPLKGSNRKDNDKKTVPSEQDSDTGVSNSDADNKNDLNGTGAAGNSKKNKVNIIDESPDTMKDETVNEYQGGEKTGNGFKFFDVKPEGDDVNGHVNPGGKQNIGTWN